MKLFPALEERYSTEQLSAGAAQRLAQEIAFAPVVFQVSRLMVKFGILDRLNGRQEGMTLDEIAESAGLNRYAAQVLLEASLSIGTVITQNDRYLIAKAGWFLIKDRMARVNMDFIHEVCYQGLFDLEATLLSGKPEGLKVFGNWPTIYEGLSQLPETAREKWLAFDHYYSDNSFPEALEIVFAKPVAKLLDVGGNTGRWALQCVGHNQDVEVTIMDLPQQLGLMHQAVQGQEGAERIHGHPANLLDPAVPFPEGYQAIWMSQFLDCFSEEEVTGILSRAAKSMGADTDLYIMEPFWDRQKYETAAYCLTQSSVYFTAMANGNSKFYHSEDMIRCVGEAGLKVAEIRDGLGRGHSILRCRKA
ncbi:MULTISPECIES: methyltransferase [unclassified Neisseria]|uniref:methyltransferase n=1 Tax=unclassified Neisseria TaxID=2623750 RepID=UPI002666C103|nr:MULTISPECIES: class I SAM-dependent methyltransferase [unclassified Neisseria]MDO1509709.1 class I SAM-dependent methyltransferase [Neisseria sp. MVDL19-042950]MDO1515967.1 class I SAM-dependent methyltransferase [Neisseria sp. MVDL18-041461]MDO1563080.1 class I SAM-dependent methyltransferase [Neisseria sp. MVDL20-010259]